MSNQPSKLWLNGPDFASWEPPITIDAVKQADHFGPYDSAYSAYTGPLTSAGFPVGKHAIKLIDGDYDTGGTYTFRGVGRLSSVRGAPQRVAFNALQNNADGTCSAELTVEKGTVGLTLLIDGDLTSYEILRPGYKSAENIVTDDFVEMIKDAGGLRVLDLCKINHTIRTKPADVVKSWATRSKLSDPIWTNKGMPLEAVTKACNLAGIGLWLPLWYTFGEADQKACAEYLAANLKGPLIVTFCNEMWMIDRDYGFRQGVANFDAAQVDAKTDKTIAAIEPWGIDVLGQAYRRYARESIAIARRFLAAFGGDRNRCRPLLECHRVNSNVLRHALAHCDAAGVKPADFFYGISFDGYFPLRKDLITKATLTADEGFAGIEWDAAAIDEALKQDEMAKARGLRVLGYECGPDLGNTNDHNIDVPAKVAMQSDPRMGDVVRKAVGTWRALGRDIMCWYLAAGRWSTRFSNFGLTDHPARRTGVKFAAFAAEARAWREDPPVVTDPTEPAPKPTDPAIGKTGIEKQWIAVNDKGTHAYVELTNTDGKKAVTTVEFK